MLFNRLIFRICILISLALPLYYLVGAMQYAQRTWELKRIGIITTASIQEVERFLVEDDDGDYYVYYYTVSFEDQLGFPHLVRLDRDQDVFEKGGDLSIIYHPEDATMAQRYIPNRLIWYPIWNFIGTLLLWGIIFSFWYAGFLWPVIGETYLSL
jgi:hypothetical protein